MNWTGRCAAVVLTSIAPVTALAADPEPTPVQRWTFDQDTLHQPPPGFEFGFTGRGRPGTWVVEDQNGVPSAPNALVQSEGDAGRAMTRFALAGSKKYADVRVRVRCKPLHGGTEKGCGVIVHWQSDSQYVLARASALKHEVVLFVQSGEIRRELGRKKASVAAGRWLTLAVEAKGETLTVRLDGKVVLSVKDGMARGNGRFGVATEADAHSMFDDLEVWDAK